MGYEIEDEVIRRYLLAQLAEDERQQLEEKIMVDNELFNRVLLAEDEMVEEYVQGELSESDRAGFESSFLSTPQGREQVSFAKALSRYVSVASASEAHATTETAHGEPARVTEEVARDSKISRPVWWRRPALVPYFRLAAAAVIVVGLGIGIWRVFFYQSEVSKGIAALAQAYREQRPLEARISGFNYAPAANTRGEQAKTDQVALDRAERILLDAVFEHPGSASHHALGRLYLAQQQFDKAIAQFEEALKADPNNAQLHNDYGAALLELGKAYEMKDDSARSLELFAKALEHFNRALELDGKLLEALFNRATCHEHMKLLHQAEEDWRAYLEKDSKSGWADEARQHLRSVEEQKDRVSQNREQLLQEFVSAYRARDDARAWRIASQNKEAMSGKSIAEQLLNAYLSSALTGNNEEASNMLQTVSYLGALESQRGGDNFTSGLAEFYGSLSRKELVLLDRAYRLMAAGKNYYIHAKNSQAIDAFGSAKRVFKQLGDERAALVADYYIAYSYPDRADIQHSKLLYEQLSQVLQSRNHKWLLMRVNVGLSVVSFSLNDYSKAIEFANRSLELAKQMNDANGALNAWSCLIEYYRQIGSYHQALHCAQMSLPLIDPGSLGIVQIWRHYAIIASALNSAELYSAAVDCQREALWLAQQTDNPATLCVSYAHLGLMLGKAGNYNEAIKNVQLAYETARSCPDKDVGKSQMAYAALQMGHLYRQTGEFARALESYDESTEIYKNLQFPTFLYQAHKGKLICYVAQQNDWSASQEIQVTLDMVEKYRGTILEGENRNNFFDIEQSVYDLAADFEYSRMNNRDKAFEYSEWPRARSLLDLLNIQSEMPTKTNTADIGFQTVTHPFSLATIQQRLPEASEILQYAVLPNKILMWVITKDECLPDEFSIDVNDLNEKVGDYLSAISRSAALDARDVSPRAKELFDILISRVEPRLDRGKRLCIVPDKILTSLPFASLISPKTNEYLIRNYEITYSPSASVFVLCSEEAKRKEGGRPERVLSVGNPRFDRNKFTSLGDLQSATAEAEGVSACYGPGSSRCLMGGAAQKSLVESEMPKAEVVHFALHSVRDENSPMRSKLILAADPSSASTDDYSKEVLESFEVCRLELPRTRLVVLSACQTGSDRYYKGEGMLSMARSFLVAHVPLTVASLWAVDSDSTKELMIRFHKHRRDENVSTAEALRRAQLAMLDVPDSSYRDPYHWASFVAIGGQTSF
jgi:CHAT domain-containing protein/Tfp pilus assembly protein PilF